MSVHLVTGAGGQDGRLLTRLLVCLGHTVIATGPGHTPPSDVPAAAGWIPLDVTATREVRRVLETYRPDAVHHLAARSSVAASWHDPAGVDLVNHRATVGLIDAAREVVPEARLIHASTSDVFGVVPDGWADESTPLRPQSPYAEAKAAAHEAVRSARLEGLAATNLVLFGHTGPEQPERFVIPTICRQAVEVAAGSRQSVDLLDPDVARDWGSAEDVALSFAAAASGPPDDYVIATGTLHRLEEIAEWALDAAGTRAPVRRVGETRRRDVGGVRGDASRARQALGWSPRVDLADVVRAMVAARMTPPSSRSAST